MEASNIKMVAAMVVVSIADNKTVNLYGPNAGKDIR